VSLLPDEEIFCEIRKNIFFSSGIHPCFIPSSAEAREIALNKLQARITKKQIVAVGECGIDRMSETAISLQIEIFERQIEMATKAKMPLLIHCVRAYSEILAVRKNAGNLDIPFCLHGFNGSAKLAEQLIEKNFILSFGHRLLNSGAKHASLLLAKNHVFFLENDKSSIDIKEIYHLASQILGIEIEELKKQMIARAQKILFILG
jgi:TatD DNase family protein